MTDTLESREALALLELAVEKMHHGALRSACSDLESALRLAPDQPRILSYYGLCLASDGRHGEGVDACRRATRLRPQDVQLRVHLGRALKIAGDKRAAHRTFLAAWYEDKRHAGAAAELTRMGIRRPPVFRFLPRGHWCNIALGRLRARLERALR